MENRTAPYRTNNSSGQGKVSGTVVRVSMRVGALVGSAVGVGTSVGVLIGRGVFVGTSVGVLVGRGVSVGTSVGVSVGRGVSVGTGVSVGVSVGVGDGIGVHVLVGRGVRVGIGVLVGRSGLSLGLFVGLPDTANAGCTMKASTSSIAVPEFSKVIFTNLATTDPKEACTVCELEIVPLKPARCESYTTIYSTLSLLLLPSAYTLSDRATAMVNWPGLRSL